MLSTKELQYNINMTNGQINIAIAKACGRSNDDIERGYVPDYCNDKATGKLIEVTGDVVITQP